MDASTFKVTVDGCVRWLGPGISAETPAETPLAGADAGGSFPDPGAVGRTPDAERTELILWGITDSNYCEGHDGQCFDNCTFPSRWCGTPVEATLLDQYRAVVKRLVARGFRDQFVDVEFFIRGRDDAERARPENVRVMEVNTRMFPQMAPVYRTVLVDGDQYDALVRVGRGLGPAGGAGPRQSNGLVGSNFYVNIFLKEGAPAVRADDVIDFAFASTLAEHVEMKVNPGDELRWDIATRKCGLCVAMFYVVSRSLACNKRRADAIRGGLIRDHALLP
jgi:hypothetical protein